MWVRLNIFFLNKNKLTLFEHSHLTFLFCPLSSYNSVLPKFRRLSNKQTNLNSCGQHTMSNYFTQHSQYKTHHATTTATKAKQITSPKTTSIGTYQVIQKAGQSGGGGANLTAPQQTTATATFKNVQNTIATAATTYPAKTNSHLLDHGYGATLQPSFTLDPPKKDNDRITNYYKASRDFGFVWQKKNGDGGFSSSFSTKKSGSLLHVLRFSAREV